MRAIVNGKLYDTETSSHIATKFVPYIDYSSGLDKERLRAFEIYKTQKGNAFVLDKKMGILLDSDKVKQLLSGEPQFVEVYMELFGMPEEA